MRVDVHRSIRRRASLVALVSAAVSLLGLSVSSLLERSMDRQVQATQDEEVSKLIEEYLPYYSESGVALRELLHTRSHADGSVVTAERLMLGEVQVVLGAPRVLYQNNNGVIDVHVSTRPGASKALAPSILVHLDAPDFALTSNDVTVSAALAVVLTPTSDGDKKIVVKLIDTAAPDRQAQLVLDIRVHPPVKAFGLTSAQLDVLKMLLTAIGFPSVGALFLLVFKESRKGRK